MNPTAGKLLSEWELWACAHQQITQYGPDASVQAAMRSDALLADGDIDGHRAWLAILERIRMWSSGPDGEVSH